MHIRKFTGGTAKKAMDAVKAEFGPDALIMSSKRSSTGGFEVVAAIDYDLSSPINVDPRAQTRAGRPHPVSTAARPQAGPSRVVPAYAASDAELKKEISELREVKELFQTVITRSSAPVARLYERLQDEFTKNGVDRRLARKILVNAFNGVSRERSGDEAALKAHMKNKLYEKIKVTDPLSTRSVVAFVGPAGVGKTTTIAKLAAINVLKQKRKVALLTTDTYRIAATEQLKTYGKIIGVPVEVAADEKELASRLSAHRDKDLVLIDTAGRSHRDARHMAGLCAMARVNPAVRFNLVLSSQTRDEALYESVQGYSAAPVDSLTFTRLDEGSVYGPILNTMLLSRKPVAYLANGQNVPQDIEAASKRRLVDFFMPN
ncbi:MAG: flagellar biosynthesis protein FlhF [Thermodesulfobacteriota bacterium]